MGDTEPVCLISVTASEARVLQGVLAVMQDAAFRSSLWNHQPSLWSLSDKVEKARTQLAKETGERS